MSFLFLRWEWDFKIEKHIRHYDCSSIDLALPESGVCLEEDLKRITAPFSKAFYSGAKYVGVFTMVKLIREAGQKAPAQLNTLYSYPLPARPEGLENYA